MRIFIASLGTETSTFALFPTSVENFKRHMWTERGIEELPPSPSSAAPRKWVELARENGWEVVEGLHAWAQPAGITTRAAYESMRDRILDGLRATGRVDAVLLSLHGAMIADGYDDCEGDLVSRVRDIVGSVARIGVELDLHAHIDETILHASDIIVIYKTYPHVDYVERAEDLFRLMQRTLDGEIEPVMALFDCRAMGLFPTTHTEAMSAFVDDMIACEGKGGILSLSLNHGFPWADVPLSGAKMLCVADSRAELAQRASEDFGRRFYAIRAEADLRFTPFDAAIEEAKRAGSKPLLLADTADQVGSGAPGDTTHVLRAFIEAGIRNAAVVPIWDPLAADICFQVGVGAKLMLRIGGKLEPHSGPPLDAEAEVIFLKRNAVQRQLETEFVSLGDVAVVKVEGIEVMLTTRRVNVFSPSIFESHGISFADKQVVSIKNLYKHRDIFQPITRGQLFVATPGTSNPDWKSLPFERLPRPIWPLDADPLNFDAK
ncbi:MAG: M81 family metallopeptidase [Albidovulum sp.]|nr:M81 family metallopeptidase [Albidovulum sp.]